MQEVPEIFNIPVDDHSSTATPPLNPAHRLLHPTDEAIPFQLSCFLSPAAKTKLLLF